MKPPTYRVVEHVRVLSNLHVYTYILSSFEASKESFQMEDEGMFFHGIYIFFGKDLTFDLQKTI